MTVVVVVLAVVVVGLLALLGAAAIRIETLQESMRETAGHAMCLDRLSAHHFATMLRNLADRWDSVEEKAALILLAQQEYQPGGSSMPTLWLRYKADLIEQETTP